MKKVSQEEIAKAAKDFSDKQGEVPSAFAFQAGIKWFLNKQKEKQDRITILEQYEESVEKGKQNLSIPKISKSKYYEESVKRRRKKFSKINTELGTEVFKED